MTVFGWGAFDDIQQAQEAAQRALDPYAVQKKEALDIINKEGRGICEWCGEEIIKSEHSLAGGWTWESEFMLGWCDTSKDRKHKPLVRYVPDQGVTNVEP